MLKLHQDLTLNPYGFFFKVLKFILVLPTESLGLAKSFC